MADTESILQLGIEAARAGDKAEARELFRLVTREKPDSAQGWLWLAGVAEDREEKRTALEHVIALDPNNELARKGLAAMGGATAVAAAAMVKPTVTATPTPSAEAATPPPATPAADTSAVASTADEGARTYDTPVAPTDDDNWTPTFADDDFDLQDYQQTPRATTDDDEYQAGVVDEEEEEERRGSIGWLPWLLGLIAIALMVYLGVTYIRNRGSGPQTAGGVESGITAEATSSAIEGGAMGSGTDATATSGDAGGAVVVTAAPGDGSMTAVPAEQTAPVGTEQTTLPAEQVPPAEQTAPPATGGEVTAEQPTVIVVVPPDATVVPPVVEPTVVPPPAEVAPTEAPAAPATSGGDVAAANPAVVPEGTEIQAGAWRFVYTGAQNVSTSAFGDAVPSKGQYQIVVVNVANGSGQPAAIPDGFFAMKDGQGRVYEFNRAASVDYVNRYGRGQAADISADEQVAPTNTYVSVGLLFDVAPDATNLVLLSRDNVNQGFLIR